jgi:hypothetical protein
MSRLVSAFLAFAVFAVAGHAAALYLQPRQSTDATLAAIRERGAQWNRYTVGHVRTTERNLVVRDNPDTITGFSMMDLSEGPLLFTLPAPRLPLYWSVSVYEHDTDTVAIVNDKAALQEVRLAFARPGQVTPSDYTRVEPGSDVAVLLVRAIMPDRNDSAQVEAIRAELGEGTLTAMTQETDK